MKKFVAYIPSPGNKAIIRTGVCLDEDFDVDMGDGSVRIEIENDTVTRHSHYVNSENVIVAYTEQELITKANIPSRFHTWDMETFTWVDTSLLSTKKLNKWEEIKAIRSSLEFSSFTWDTSEFDADSESQRRIQGAAQLAMIAVSANQSFEIDWTLANNSVRTLSGEEMISVGLALGTHVNTIYATARILRENIENCTTKEEVDAIIWP